jgi:hypothetical protein
MAAYLKSKNKDFSELKLMDSTTNRKGTTTGATAGVKHESEELDNCLAGVKLEPNVHDTVEMFRKVKLLANDTITVLPPR